MKNLTKNNSCLVGGTNPLTQLINNAIANKRISSSDGDIFSKRLSDASIGKLVLNEHDEKIYNEITKGFDQGFNQENIQENKIEQLNKIFEETSKNLKIEQIKLFKEIDSNKNEHFNHFQRIFFHNIKSGNIENLKNLDNRKYDISQYSKKEIENIVSNKEMLRYFLDDPNYTTRNKYMLQFFLNVSCKLDWSFATNIIVNHPVFKNNLHNIDLIKIIIEYDFLRTSSISLLLPFIKEIDLISCIDKFNVQTINNITEYYIEKGNLNMVINLLPHMITLDFNGLWTTWLKYQINNIEILKLLLHYKNNFRQKDIQKTFDKVCKEGLLEQVKLLLPYIDNINELWNLWIVNKNIEILNLFLQYKIKHNYEYDLNILLIEACKEGLNDQASILLPYIDNIDNEIFNVLVKNNNLNMIKLLFNNQQVQKEIVYYSNLVMNDAMRYDKKEIVDFLLKNLDKKDVFLILDDKFVSLAHKHLKIEGSL